MFHEGNVTEHRMNLAARPPDHPRPAVTVFGMRLGVLDVGSNTVHLLVVDAYRGGHPTPMHSEKTQLRLAEHLEAGHLTRAGAGGLGACRGAGEGRRDVRGLRGAPRLRDLGAA
jgi:hypothetical protein